MLAKERCEVGLVLVEIIRKTTELGALHGQLGRESVRLEDIELTRGRSTDHLLDTDVVHAEGARLGSDALGGVGMSAVSPL